MSYQRHGAYSIVKRLQYIEEVTFGVTPNASPVFIHAGKIKNFSFNVNAAIERYRSLGLRTVCKFLQTGQLYSFEIEYQPIDSVLMKYGTNDPAGTGTIEKTLSFIYSKLLNGVENFIFLKGCSTDSISVEITPQAVNVTQSFLCREVTTPATTHGLTTPTFATNPTSKPWVGLDSGSNPLTFNALNYDTPRFSFEVAWNLDAAQPNGETLIKFLDHTNKDVNVDFDVYQKDTTLIADVKSGVERAVSYVLKAATSTATFTNFVGETYDLAEDADANETTNEAVAGGAENVSLT